MFDYLVKGELLYATSQLSCIGKVNLDSGLLTTDGLGNVTANGAVLANLSGGVSPTAPATITGGTLATSAIRVSKSNPAGAITGVILQAGTLAGQEVTVVNIATGANTITMAAAGTSNVANGVSTVIAGLTAARFVWDATSALWYHSV